MSGAIVPARAGAAHIHSKMKGGFMAMSAYLRVDELFGPNEIRLLTEVASYTHRAQALGFDWVLGADFNMRPAMLQAWAASFGGV
eukprot:276320-Pyramimonas_sp.AAC.1